RDPHVIFHIWKQFFENLIERLKFGDTGLGALKNAITDDMLLQGPKVNIEDLEDVFLRLIKIRSLLKRYVKSNIPIFKGQRGEEQLAMYINDGTVTIEKHFKDVKLQGKRPIIWATFAEDVEKELNINENIDDLCDRLGLSDFNRCDQVAELRYDANKIENQRVSTVVDAGENHAFYPSMKGDPFGDTRDLKNNREGFPEIVHGPIDIKKIDYIRSLGHKIRDASEIVLD
ncbi:hypothetical protein ACFLRB_05405, partial [Acidobacteriota bacterium]